jgi:acetyl esterase
MTGLHPRFEEQLRGNPPSPLSLDNLRERREALERDIPFDVGTGETVARVERLVCGGASLLYAPLRRRIAGVIVYAHGGGWVMGSPAAVDGVCRRLANSAGCTVLSVGYRLAPEHPWPTAFEDVLEALDWALGLPVASVGGRMPVVVAGDSAGAHLATLAAMRARDDRQAVVGQVLIYPALDPDMSSTSFDAFDGYALPAQHMRFFWTSLTGSDAHGQPARPMERDLTGLAPALVLTAEFDVLRDEGERYAALLAAAGVPTVATRYLGATHGFFRRLARFEAAQAAVGQVASFAHSRLAERTVTQAAAR